MYFPCFDLAKLSKLACNSAETDLDFFGCFLADGSYAVLSSKLFYLTEGILS